MLKNLGDLLNSSGLDVADSQPYICNATGSCSWSGTNTMGKDFDLLRILFIFPLMVELPFFLFLGRNCLWVLLGKKERNEI